MHFDLNLVTQYQGRGTLDIILTQITGVVFQNYAAYSHTKVWKRMLVNDP